MLRDIAQGVLASLLGWFVILWAVGALPALLGPSWGG